jgi:hypothetical protein
MPGLIDCIVQFCWELLIMVYLDTLQCFDAVPYQNAVPSQNTVPYQNAVPYQDA